MRLLRTGEGSRGWPPSDFRASVPLRRVGPEETGASRIRSIPWSRRTSRASNTRSALTTRRWCSIPLKEEATPGPVASHCRNGSWGPPATALTPRARCGRSFVSTRVGGNNEAPALNESHLTYHSDGRLGRRPFQLFPPSARASAQRTASDVRADRLPVSVSLPFVVGWAALAPHLGFGFSGVTLSAQVSAAANAGVTVRQWYSYLSRESCGLNQSECALEQQTTSLALLAHVEFYPLHDALFFVRAAAGTSWLREQHAADSVIHESRSWPLTVLTAAGWDIRVKGHA